MQLLFFYTLIFLYGSLIGSFLNVCIYRIPRNESIIKNRSHCMICGATIKNKDLIPVFSYLLIRGKCRVCGTKISIQYPLIEFINGVIYIFIFSERGIPLITDVNLIQIIISILYCLTASALLVLSIIDFRTYEIPVKINLFILVIGLIRMGLDYRNWSLYLIGFFCISSILYIIYLISGGNAIGGGDIKLMAAAGLLLGWKNILLALFFGCLFGSVIHILRMKISHADHVLAMGPYLSLGIFFSMLYGDRIWNWYLGFLL